MNLYLWRSSFEFLPFEVELFWLAVSPLFQVLVMDGPPGLDEVPQHRSLPLHGAGLVPLTHQPHYVGGRLQGGGRGVDLPEGKTGISPRAVMQYQTRGTLTMCKYWTFPERYEKINALFLHDHLYPLHLEPLISIS